MGAREGVIVPSPPLSHIQIFQGGISESHSPHSTYDDGFLSQTCHWFTWNRLSLILEPPQRNTRRHPPGIPILPQSLLHLLEAQAPSPDGAPLVVGVIEVVVEGGCSRARRRRRRERSSHQPDLFKGKSFRRTRLHCCEALAWSRYSGIANRGIRRSATAPQKSPAVQRMTRNPR
jgi:hypothetical protein